jgi:hypothetical protein
MILNDKLAKMACPDAAALLLLSQARWQGGFVVKPPREVYRSEFYINVYVEYDALIVSLS